MNRSILAVAVASLLPYASSFAQSNSVDETVVVTASRFEQPIKEVLAPVSVVTKEEIDAIQAKSLADVLRRLPGVQVISGGLGQDTTVFVRGASSKHLLVMINGVRIGSATLGSADFSKIPLTGIDRIELIRGSRAALYGSDAIGGVLNIITEYNAGEQLAQINAGLGSDGYTQFGGSFAGAVGESSWAKFAIKTEQADGFSARKEPFESDDDGFEAHNIVAEVGTDINSNLKLRLQGYYNDAKTDYDDTYGATGAYTESSLYNVAAKLEYVRDNLASQFTIAQNQDKGQNNSKGVAGSEIATDRLLINWQNHYQFNEQFSLGGGLEFYRDSVSNSTTVYEEDERDNFAAYINSIYIAGDLQLEASLRGDDNDSYGENTTWLLGAAYTFVNTYQIAASAGTGFRAPSFNDFYWPGSGNPNLKPEESFNYELSLSGSHALLDWQVTGYRNDVEQLIAWAPIDDTNPASDWIPMNVEEARLQGIEFTTQFDTGLLRHELSYDYLDATDTKTDKQLIRRSKHSAKWNIAYVKNQWQFDVSSLYKGKSYEDAQNTKELEAFVLFDVATSYSVNENLVLRARVANLFDEDYTSKESYNVQERSYYGLVEYNF
ncbi:outer membrane cobalamin receptor protein [Vibrio sp. N418]|uniref:TonB-dependent receptor domain-containing protein n=1 Tax=Vibrio sp. (strain N418) TaxID=701176 RepID=UPI00021BE57A|nr:TonB-dependent receptor [Vibrio sp. N418]EGU37612.1 outer membrane cobalamin receptor protein [Vibrio sp. N418]